MSSAKIASQTEGANVKNLTGITTAPVVPVVNVRLDGQPKSYPGGPGSKGLSKFLRDSGSSAEMNIDGSVTPVTFSIAPPVGSTYHIAALDFVLLGGSMQLQQFGSQAALANGIQIGLYGDHPIGGPDIELLDFVDGEDVRTLAEFPIHMTESVKLESPGSGDDMFVGNILFLQNLDQHVTLNGDNNESVKIIINDDLTSQAQFRCKAVGFEYTKS